ncbi:MAG: tRNA pseudouridine(55) synthase TruB [Spirochaetaceae bacterium]|nr:tRNA pseudouridine(55) synthase TruB [Spirochaetaceae bacterium]
MTRSISSPHDALLLLNKPTGITSFAALSPVKKALGCGKVGHTGTLDKFADGLLLVLTGRALKLSPYFTNCGKHYEALVRLGTETDTLDPEGRVVAEAGIPSKDTLEAVLDRFRGDIMQVPPLFSAIHLGGKRAYKLARAGTLVEIKPRPVTVHELYLSAYDPPFARLSVHCSSGTYIRSLARDIAIAAGSRAHLAGLTRTRVGAFLLPDALDLKPDSPPDHDEVINALLPIDRRIFDALSIPVREVDEKIAAAMRCGKPLGKDLPPIEASAPRAAVFCRDSFITLLERRPPSGSYSSWRYAFVF